MDGDRSDFNVRSHADMRVPNFRTVTAGLLLQAGAAEEGFLFCSSLMVPH